MAATQRPAVLASVVLLVLGLGSWWASPAAGAVGGSEGPAVAAEVWRAYRAAIVDSATSTPAEVATDLLVPTPADPRTRWRTIDGEEYLLVGQMRYAPFTGVAEGDRFTVTTPRWVSIPAELGQACTQYRCRRMSDAELDLQLKMINGLPPDADYSTVMHFWVRPADLFRPCTDPRITTATCPQQVVVDETGQPVVPVVGSTPTTAFLWTQANYAWRMPDRLRPTVAASCAKDWNRADCHGFPWTRLGYTYDWTPGATDEVGVTEFVVAAGATAYMEAIGTQREFFPRP